MTVPQREAATADCGDVRIVLADDHDLICEGIAAVLAREPDLTLIAVTNDETGATDLLGRMRPDLLLIDLSISRRDPICLLREIVAAAPTLRILVLAAYAEQRYAERVVCTGASGYFIKSASASELVHVIRAVMAGETCAGTRLSHPNLTANVGLARADSASP
ncbi:MAG: response regulator transcription factor [Verrucomicrobiota bacterium]|nr:response regulator transcription factor [Verrucomicrobiota bacterium]